MELLSCRTRPRHPFHAAYSHRKVNTFLLLLACPTFPATSALLANWFRFAGKKEGERNGKEGEGEDSIPKNTEANKSISFFFPFFRSLSPPAVFPRGVTWWQKEADMRGRNGGERVSGWLERAGSPGSILISGSLLMETSG